MNVKCLIIALAAILFAGPAVMHAQFDFTVANLPFQIHSFASQGYEYSNDNNYLTMKSGGSFAMTDGGVNISTQLTDHFRVGAQVYDRKIGHLGDGTVQLDWAEGDYKFKDWFGVRAGKVKTVLGLYNDTQDMTFLYTWAILPQSMYSLDLRGLTMSHEGGDVYGTFGLKKLGDLSYTGYVGRRPNDPTGGYVFGTMRGAGDYLTSESGRVAGGDLRWATPLKGFTAGASLMDLDVTMRGVVVKTDLPDTVDIKKDDIYAYYVTYGKGNLKVDGEYRREWRVQSTNSAKDADADVRSWYISAAYRICKLLEVGSYYSRWYANWQNPTQNPSDRIFDPAVTARFDLTRWWNIKVEGHFMSGWGGQGTFRGFYSSLNPGGLQPDTSALVVRTGWNF